MIPQSKAAVTSLALAGSAVLLPILTSFGADGIRANLPKSAEQEIVFAREIKPVLERSCLQCHSGEKPKSKFRVDSREALLTGGESQEPALVPGKSADSRLVLFVADAVREMEMPPLEKRERFPRLTSREIGLLRAWIDQGANWPTGVTLVAPAVSDAAAEAKAAPERRKSHPVFERIRLGDGAGIAQALSDPTVLTARDDAGNTPLIQAAFYLDAPLLALFLDQSADVNTANHAGVTALMKAVWDPDKTRLLLERRADANAASMLGNTALIMACYAYGVAPVVEQLIAAGADVQARNQAGGSAITAAAEAGDVAVLRLLLDHGADPNSKSRITESNGEVSALMTAAQLGHLDFVKLLLARGADVNLATEHGNALHFATFTHRKEITRLLLDRGIDVNTTGRRLLSFRKDTGLTALIYEALNEQNDPTIVSWLIERGAHVNAKASSGDTALGLARQRGSTKIVEALLAAGAKQEDADEPSTPPSALWGVDQVTEEGVKLARRAAEAGVALLLKSGARLTEATANRCGTCHQQNLPALACSLLADRGLEYPKQLAQEELRATIKGAQRFRESSVEQPFPVPNIPSWLLIGLAAAHYPADSLTDHYAYALARHQSGDGRWITKASRAPTDYSDVTSTALAVRALKMYGPPSMKAKLDERVAKGARWLRQCQASSTEERAMQMLGLYWFGSDHALLQALGEELLNEQRPDGGWAQIPTLESDAYATGLALFALHVAGGVAVHHPGYEKGLKALLRWQCNDGSWFVKTRVSPVQVAIADIFPHGRDQWSSSLATGWASMALALATAPTPVSDLGAKPNYTIALASFAPVNSDIFVADADGSNVRPFLPHPEQDYNASFSKDGEWIVFTSERHGSADIYRAPPDGSRLERLTADPAFDDQGTLSPDGKCLAFVSTRSGQADIWLLDLETQKLRNLTVHPGGDFRPAWSPDGTWIAFSSDRNSKKTKGAGGFATLHSTEIFVVRPDGTGLRQMTDRDAFAGSPKWSADGKELLFYEAELDEVDKITTPRRLRGVTQLATIDLQTGTRRVLTSQPGEKWSPHWLPDGRIAYASGGPDGGIEFATGGPGAHGEFGSPSWSAHGKQMVFHREVEHDWPPVRPIHSPDPQFRLVRTGVFPSYSPSGDKLVCMDSTAAILSHSILLMNPDGSHRSVLFNAGTNTPLCPSWSPRGDQIVFGLGRFFQMAQGRAPADIAVIGSDGNGLRMLTTQPGNHGFPSWSPDAKQIVFRRSGGDNDGLFILDVETGSIRRLTAGSNHDNFPAWSPTDDVIAFTTYRDGDYEIYTIKADGTGLRRLTRSQGNDAHCTWSPDGKWIAFASERGGFKDEAVLHPYNGQPYGDIFVMRPDGSDLRQLTDNQYEEATPAWMPLSAGPVR